MLPYLRLLDAFSMSRRAFTLRNVSFVLFLATLVFTGSVAHGQQITDLATEPTKFIEITCPPSQSGPANPVPPNSYNWVTYGALYRVPAASNLTVFSSDATKTVYRDTNWQVNVRYQYVLPFVTHSLSWNAGTGQWVSTSTPGTTSCYCTVRQVFVGDNQTVDSRLDMRYSTEQFKDFAFKDGIYRGGLFVGNNQDGARVSRSYLKFSLLGPLVGGEQMWNAGGLYVYMTRMTKTGSASLLIQAAQDTWLPNELVWTNQPTLIGTRTTPFSVDWNSASPLSKWYRVKTLKDIEQELGSDSILTLQLRASSETSTGWPYFAKKEYTPVGSGDMRSYLLYAFGGTGIP